jgi:membrane dipeptidase
MDELNMVLDVTHLSDTSFWQSLEVFNGHIWASHSNCRSLVDHNRQFTDEQIRVIIERNGIIGMPLDAWMMVPNWKRGISHPENTEVTLDTMIDHLDHICQVAGNANHVALGTDLDGGFGIEQCPSDINSIADLQKLPTLLKSRGYSEIEIEGILSRNWIRKFHEVLPSR